ncbi:hypothetical protein HC928_05265 [bacterium]|nr:hypothetical protein [bacterium]
MGRIEPIFEDNNGNQFTIRDLSLTVGETIRQARTEEPDSCENIDLRDPDIRSNTNLYVRAGYDNDPVFDEIGRQSSEEASQLRVDVATIVVPDYLRHMKLTDIVIYDDYDLHRKNEAAPEATRGLTHDPFIIVYGITLDILNAEGEQP